MDDYRVTDLEGDDLMGHEPSDRFGYPSDAVRAAFVKWQKAVEVLNDEMRAAYVKWQEGIEALGPSPLDPAPVPPESIESPASKTPLTLLREMGNDGPSGNGV